MKSKKAYLEWIRIFAIFFVLYVHTGTNAVAHYLVEGSGVSAGLAFSAASVAQTCNVLFFMVSGAVLLHKKESIRRTLLRFVKMAVVVLVFSLLQYAFNYFRMPAMGFRLSEFFQFVYHDTVITQYWFLYDYLAFLLILPFLRSIAEKLDKVMFLYLALLYVIIWGVLPLVEYFKEYEPFGIAVPMLQNILFYPLIGYFAEHNPDNLLERKWSLIGINAAGAVGLIIDVIYSRTRYLEIGYTEHLMGMIMLTALLIFVDIRCLCRKYRMPLWLERTVVWCGGGVFGVCLLEPQLREGAFFLYQRLEPVISWLPATIIWLGAAMAAGIVIMNVLKWIPVLKKLF